MTLLDVSELSVRLKERRGSVTVVDNISFTVSCREVLSIVGESGSGKSMTAKALMGLLPAGAAVSGNAEFEGVELVGGHAERIRGRGMSMIFQEPMTALNPVLSIGKQMTEASVVVGGVSQREADKSAVELLDRVGIDGGASRLRQYPHEFSGGMRQRVMIAMAMMMSPRLLIADEPTTALDVTIQAQILDLLKQLVTQSDMGLVLITHDMGVVAETADKVLVMKNGCAVELDSVGSIFSSPSHPYTQQLLAAVPRLDSGTLPNAASDKNSVVLQVDNISKSFKRESGLFAKAAVTTALDDISLQLSQGETLALVGESGSGKSTLGRAITRLLSVDKGVITVNGRNIAELQGAELKAARAATQMVFQDPYSSLDPRCSIGRTIAEPMIIHGTSKSQARAQVKELLVRVGLAADMASRYPHEFSGGQRQRIAIARALATSPAVLVADEPTSALDVSIQAQILDLLKALKAERNLSVLFISHDLAVVRQVADRIAVMRAGRIVETGRTLDVLQQPQHEYTRLLINSAPVPDPNRRRGVLQAATVS